MSVCTFVAITDQAGVLQAVALDVSSPSKQIAPVILEVRQQQ